MPKKTKKVVGKTVAKKRGRPPLSAAEKRRREEEKLLAKKKGPSLKKTAKKVPTANFDYDFVTQVLDVIRDLANEVSKLSSTVKQLSGQVRTAASTTVRSGASSVYSDQQRVSDTAGFVGGEITRPYVEEFPLTFVTTR